MLPTTNPPDTLTVLHNADCMAEGNAMGHHASEMRNKMTNSNPECKFWMVKAIDGGAPNVMHKSKKSANDEAQRLAETNPGRAYAVLEATNAWSTPKPKARSFTYGMATANDQAHL